MESTFGLGWLSPNDTASQFNQQSFFVWSLLNLVRTAAIVQVVSVTNSGGVSPVGTVEVLPLVNMVDGNLNAYPHGVLPPLPYARVQGGASAVILDPAVGDIGIAVIGDRDGSLALSKKAQANPGSIRQFDFADGVYLFTITGAAPTQYIQFTATGINIVDVNGNIIAMGPSGVEITSETVSTSSVLQAGNGASGTFTSQDGKTITVADGIVVSIV